jgi:phage I-like protein
MPDPEGIARALRERAPQLPIVGLTAHAFAEERQRFDALRGNADPTVEVFRSFGDLNPSPQQAQAVVQAMQAQIAALTAQQATDALRGKVTAALADGRLLPAMQGWAEAQLAGTADQRAALSSYIDSAVPMPALAGSQTAALAAAGGAGGDKVAALSAVELEICARMDIAPDAFAAQKNGGKPQ